MNFTLENRENVVVFFLKNANVDGKVAAEFKAKLLIEAQPDIDALVIDLSNVEAMDSSGLGALLLAHRQLKEHGIPVILVGVQDFVKSLLNITRIDELFEYFDTVDDAVEAVNENSDID